MSVTTLEQRIPELDSLRGVAILSVFAYHGFFWSGLQPDSWTARAAALVTRPGWLGVDLFFVLSGFLITGRLLDHRHLPLRDFYRWFYTRRALRILPLYYITLAVVGAAMLQAGETSPAFLAAAALYLPNIALVAGLQATAPLAVLWSLGIEEQVYLIWPIIARHLTARRLATAFIAIGLVEPLARYGSVVAGFMPDHVSMATWLRLDGFAWGGLLAVLVRGANPSPARIATYGGTAMVIGAATALACARFGVLSRQTSAGAALQCASADLFFAGVVAACVARGSRVRAAGPATVLRYFGRVSYCLYLVHQFVFWIFDRLTGATHPMDLPSATVRAAIVLAVSALVAELSWRRLEQPCLALKPAAA